MSKFEINDVVFHKKKAFIGYIVKADSLDEEVIATPKGVVTGVKSKNLIKVSEALDGSVKLRGRALQAIQDLPEGSTAVDDSGDLWIRTSAGWTAALFSNLTMNNWISKSTVRIYPALSKTVFINKKEASCVES
jgi:hypothetical protein